MAEATGASLSVPVHGIVLVIVIHFYEIFDSVKSL